MIVKKGVLMIYTITMNPSIDYYMNVNQNLIETEVNRSMGEQMKAGGKGINVSAMLNKYGISSIALVLLGGFTGDYIEEEIHKYLNVQLVSIPIEGMNRINVKVRHGEKTLCVNGKGPKANGDTKAVILNALNQVEENDWVMICGSAMQGISDDFIIKISDLIHHKKAKLVIDMEAISIKLLERCKPYLIKPNFYEFKMLMKREEMGPEELMNALDACKQKGCENILVSLGENGAILTTKFQNYRLRQDEVKAVNKVGSGDAMLASFVGKLVTGSSFEEALAYGGAAGSAVASTLKDVTMEMIYDQYLKTKVEIIK